MDDQTLTGTPLQTLSGWRLQVQRAKDFVRYGLYSMADRMGLPGVIQNWEAYDNGTFIKIEVRGVFVVISVDDMDYYFYRINGKYDGWGTGNCKIGFHKIGGSPDSCAAND